MVDMDNTEHLAEMIPAIVKTFVIAHEADSDERLAQSLVYNAAAGDWY